jgi:diaminohydroxyphosphoribosylaminopyrimidine deaminase / 5-amino-6-(5-phosphoribosylamino)uracil reductase
MSSPPHRPIAPTPQTPRIPARDRQHLAFVGFDVTDLAVQEERALALGATLVRDDDRRPLGFRVYADPEGHFFCRCSEAAVAEMERRGMTTSMDTLSTRLRGEDREWLAAAVDLAWRCPPSATAFNVGAVIVDADDRELARGWSRETDEHVHAEESALAKLGGPAAAAENPRLAGATLYSSLEPCSVRRSRPLTCTQLIIAAGIKRVVFAWREPSVLVADCQGAELLAEAGVEVVELPELAALVRAANAEVLGRA